MNIPPMPEDMPSHEILDLYWDPSDGLTPISSKDRPAQGWIYIGQASGDLAWALSATRWHPPTA